MTSVRLAVSSWMARNPWSYGIFSGAVFLFFISVPFLVIRIEGERQWEADRRAARAKGIQAAGRGIPATANPFTSQNERVAWLEGWMEAARQ